MSESTRSLNEEVLAWTAHDLLDDDRSELAALVDRGAWDELARRMGPLPLRRGGLHGELGAGRALVNLAVLRTWGETLARFLHRHRFTLVPRGVLVVHDGRQLSRDAAREVAGVLAAAGVPVRLADAPYTTAAASAAVRELGCAAGVVVSCDEPADRSSVLDAVVLDPDGSPLSPADGDTLAALAERARPADEVRSDPFSFLVVPAPDGPWGTYLDGLGRDGERPVDVVVCADGPAGAALCELWARRGASATQVPSSSAGAWNDPAALDAAAALAERVGAPLVVCADRDGRHLELVVHHDGWWHPLSGGDLAAVVCEYLLSRDGAAGGQVVCEQATDVAVAAVARRWRCRPTALLPLVDADVTQAARDLGGDVVVAVDAEGGFLVDGGRVPDAAAAAAAAGLLAAELGRRGRTLVDALGAVRRRYGVHLHRRAVLGADAAGRLWGADPGELGGHAVVGAPSRVSGPAGEVLVVQLEGGSQVVAHRGADGTTVCDVVAVEPVDPDGGGTDGAELRARWLLDEVLEDLGADGSR